MKLFAGFLAAALAQESDRWGYYDYYGNGHAHDAKHQSSQTGTEGQLAGNFLGTAAGNDEHGILGNGRICWSCSERSYGTCLGEFDTDASTTKNIGDQARHGAMYCTGEDYFCFISERRVIRHDQNDYNFEQGQPWSSGTQTVYQEESIAFGTSNQSKNTNLRVQMGCQQPMACLRQMHQNYKIDMGLPYHHTTLPLATSAAAKFAGLAREGLCRLGLDWIDYASGQHSGSNWRDGHWIGGSVRGTDRRYGAVEHHYNYGKGTESVCHYCCDPLLEFGSSTGLYDYKGCNFNALSSSAAAIESTGTDVATGAIAVNPSGLAVNLFLKRQQNWESPVWNNNQQYHGMFRNPHTHYPRKTITTNTGGAHPNA